MLGAVMFGQKHFQPVLDAIVKLAERAAKEPWELKAEDERRRACAQGRARLPRRSPRGLQDRRQA